jgi:hypothetical protein
MLGFARNELGNQGAGLAEERNALAERFRRKAG